MKIRAVQEPVFEKWANTVVYDPKAMPTIPPEDYREPYHVEQVNPKNAGTFWRVYIFELEVATIHRCSKSKKWFFVFNNRLMPGKYLTKGAALRAVFEYAAD